MPSIHKRAMNYFDRLNLGAFEDLCRKLAARTVSPSRSRRSISGPKIISDPTDFQKDPDPFLSMIALPANREYVEREGILAPKSFSKSQDLPTRSTPEQKSASSRSARTLAENSRPHLAQQAVSMSEEQTPADLAGSDFVPLENAREVKADMA